MVVRGRSRTWKMESIEMRALDEILKAKQSRHEAQPASHTESNQSSAKGKCLRFDRAMISM